MKDSMLFKEENNRNEKLKKWFFVVMAVFVIAIVVLNIVNYFVSF